VPPRYERLGSDALRAVSRDISAQLTEIELELDLLVAEVEAEGKKLAVVAAKLGIDLTAISLSVAAAVPSGGLSLIAAVVPTARSVWELIDLKTDYFKVRALRERLSELKGRSVALLAELDLIYSVLLARSE
jgi:hypothetical protein